MKWNGQDAMLYSQSKEFVDTWIVPLIPYSLAGSENELKMLANQSELLTLFMKEVEEEYRGRIFLSPSYTYLKETPVSKEIERINEWTTEMKERGFKHVLFFTFDQQWKKVEKDLESSLIWMPLPKVDDIHNEEAQKVLRSQIEQVTELITAYWQE
ncbi:MULTISPECIES: DUF2487 family protein [Pontibacillus]|uniref:DUF2487 family protein n=1 Tax=Pontibacillus chungwhensis TaxID=265426 RepID=A0ABY8URS7_9BACI|nr:MULTISPECIES: DUF2487 family protein [Pontibacillus]MCD5322981.1 YpiF family protein [Pontibacillus sp. HN14]WIF96375.1 DUF2487 family protein [Pontibacillus chungwhensis]